MLAHQPHQRIEEFCIRFSEMTGWPMRFSASPDLSAIENAGNAVWQHEVAAGNKRLGMLRIDQPHRRELDESFISACRTAESLVRSQMTFLLRQDYLHRRQQQAATLSSMSLDVDRLQRDLEYAARCHSSDGIDIASDCGNVQADWIVRNRHQVGGDFCVFRSISSRQTLIVIGDAAGNGVTAAMLAANLRGGLELEFCNELESTEQLSRKMSRLNQLMWDCAEPHQFISCVVAIYDQSLKQLFYVNAGHPCPFFQQGTQILKLESHGTMLGAMPETHYSTGVVEIESISRLMFYTDGVLECKNSEGEMFRLSRLEKMFRETSGSAPRSQFLTKIQQELMNFSAPIPIDDDYSVMVVDIEL